jgi:large subunit ribosomal protein L21
MVAGALVAAEVVKHTRGDTIVVFKKRRRKNSRRRRGHRQDFTLVRITEILTDGKQPSKTAQPRAQKARAAKPQSETAEDAESSVATKEKPKAAKPKQKSKNK